MRILLTNDDSHSSPLLKFALDLLLQVGEVTLIVPKHEQSWKGKAITRFSNLHLEEIEIGNHPAFTLDGTPADCTNFGIYHLFEKKPDLVVSGINAGLNAGISFILSSGTVGACLEANIAGVPAVALSQMFDAETRDAYIADYTLSPATLSRLWEQTKLLLPKVFDEISSNFSEPITWNVNFPFLFGKESKIMRARIANLLYGNLFKQSGDHFEHHLTEGQSDYRTDCDIHLLQEGHVTITGIDIRTVGQIGLR